MGYRDEFPDFDAHDDIAALIGRGGHDVSWHNDSCPCIGFGPEGAETLFVYVDYISDDLSENGSDRDFRFQVIQPATPGQMGNCNGMAMDLATLDDVLAGLEA